ncbi:YqcI/YcgG family protein [Neisseria weaveri]|uniref:YqcI/YcgG family protein n=1 Tax=Neisseria weaveri TaxID=28091 RepID=UPI00131C2DE4|nr:YqcI/YcgG family protein [Neisseria weaveri]
MEQFLAKVNSEQLWISETYAQFCSLLSSPEFPCPFGRKSFLSKGLFIIFYEKHKEVSVLKKALDEYIAFVKSTEVHQRLYNPLIIFFEHSGFHNIQEEHQFCWDILQQLHELDTSTWPKNIPYDANNSSWSYCYGGIELFINMSCPHHQHMKSRYLGEKIVFVVNPRMNFDVVASSKTTKGKIIRERIRERVSNYNQGYVPDELGFFGDENNYEWKRYQLLEPDEKRPQKCPFKAKERK